MKPTSYTTRNAGLQPGNTDPSPGGSQRRGLSRWLASPRRSHHRSSFGGSSGQAWRRVPSRSSREMPGGQSKLRCEPSEAKETSATLIDHVGRREHCKVLIFVNSRRVAERFVGRNSKRIFLQKQRLHPPILLSAAMIESAPKKSIPCGLAPSVGRQVLWSWGIDIGDVDLVVLYGLVGSWESFLQRIGRGNRRRRHR